MPLRPRSPLTRLVLVVAISLSTTAAQADEPLTTRQMRALPARTADRLAQHDLLSILMPIDRINTGMVRRLRGVTFQTRPAGTEYRGYAVAIC